MTIKRQKKEGKFKQMTLGEVFDDFEKFEKIDEMILLGSKGGVRRITLE
jgi:hypothetical protein